MTNPLKFGASLLEFTANLVAGGMLLAAFVGAEATTDGLATLLSNFVAGAGLQDLRNIIDGVQGMVDSSVEHNPLLDLIADGLKFIVDVVTVLVMPAAMKAITSSANIKTQLQITRFLGAFGQLLQGRPVNIGKYVGPAMSAVSTLSASVSAWGSMFVDGAQFVSDWGAYQEYGQTHG